MIRSLRLRNFRRYVDEQLDFGAGVSFIGGKNNAGKTTLFLAVEYAFFGTTAGARTPLVLVRPGESAFGVEVVFSGRDGHVYKLQRAHLKPPRAKKTMAPHFTLKQIVEPGNERYLLSSDFEDPETLLATTLQTLTGITRRVFEVAVHVRQGEVAAILDGDARLDIALGITAAATVNDEMRALALEDERAAEALPALRASLAHVEAELQRAAVDEAEAQAAVSAVLVDEDDEGDNDDGDDDEPAPTLLALQAAVTALDQACLSRDALSARKHDHHQRHGDEPTLQEALAIAKKARASVKVRRVEKQRTQTADALLRGDLSGRLQRRRAAASQPHCEHCGADIDVDRAAADIEAWQQELAALQQRADDNDNDDDNDEEAAVEQESAALRALQERTRLHAEHQTCASAADAALLKAQARASEAGDAGDPALALQTLRRAHDERRVARLASRAAKAAVARIAREAAAAAQARLAERATRTAELTREQARLQQETGRLAAREARARDVRLLATAFKTLQEDLRSRAATELAAATLRLHRALAIDDEVAAVEIDPTRYQMLVTATGSAAAGPASLIQGGGHKLLLGLAFRLALVERLGPFPFVLLDEPTYGLDDRHRQALLSRIEALGLCQQILLITHDDMGAASTKARVHIERPTDTRSALAPASTVEAP